MTTPNLPTAALAGVVARAATLKADTGATRAAAARPDLVILADTSGSMAEKAGLARKVDALRASLDSVRLDAPGARVAAFSSTVRMLPPFGQLPEPDGGTAMHLALEAATPYRRALVISDGAPDSPDEAVRVATRIVARGTRIDTLFIGADDDARGRAFMARLAAIGRGRALDLDIVRARGDRAALASMIRQLALPPVAAGSAG